eukprot:TRINITY_DN50674_c0_g1_i1.p1 TRINITY_DN50674_c0_g1~~TRINITY_DN50674_c0_g1_i1.p1  ORF type:complete len:4578 (+),score=1022.66 TRINITY_DN50674_c0_g1_i1:184-13917(+)
MASEGRCSNNHAPDEADDAGTEDDMDREESVTVSPSIPAICIARYATLPDGGQQGREDGVAKEEQPLVAVSGGRPAEAEEEEDAAVGVQHWTPEPPCGLSQATMVDQTPPSLQPAAGGPAEAFGPGATSMTATGGPAASTTAAANSQDSGLVSHTTTAAGGLLQAPTALLLDSLGLGDLLLPTDPPRLCQQDAASWSGAGVIGPAAEAVQEAAGAVSSSIHAGLSGEAAAGSSAGQLKLGKCCPLRALGDSIVWSLDFIRGIDASYSPAGLSAGLKEVDAALSACLDLLRILPSSGTDKATEIPRSEVRGQLFQFLQEVLQRIRRLAPGGFLILPGGWLRSASEPSERGHALLLVLVRLPLKTQSGKSTDSKRASLSSEFLLGVVNTGEGLEYHPVSASNLAPHPGRPLRQTPLLLSGLSARRVCTTGFWYLLYRQIVYPSRGNGPRWVYGKLLPFLNERPLRANSCMTLASLTSREDVPVAGDKSFVICVQRAVQFCLAVSGLSVVDASWSSLVCMRAAALNRLCSDLSQRSEEDLERLQTSPACVASLQAEAAKALARTAVDFAERYGGEGREEALQALHALVQKALRGAERWRQPSASEFDEPSQRADAAGDASFTKFDRLLWTDVEHRRGKEIKRDIFVPILTCRLPTSVSSIADATSCCSLVVHLLTLLSNQQRRIEFSAQLRVAVVVHLITTILPPPLACDHPERLTRCFWMAPLQYEVKMELLRSFYLIMMHFTAAALALREDAAADGARVCVAAGVVAIMDALMRRPIFHKKSGTAQAVHLTTRFCTHELVSTHYNGEAPGPGQIFGVDCSDFQEASSGFVFVTPEYAGLRAVLLDYFGSLRNFVKSDHMIFRFDESMAFSAADRRFVEQLALCAGVENADTAGPLLLTGERRDLLQGFVELGWFRDAVFLWKLLLHPERHEVPERAARDPMDLQWKWDSHAGRLKVFGFGTLLTPRSTFREMTEQFGSSTFVGGLMQAMCLPNRRSASLASRLACREVSDEEDVLYLKRLPTFNNTLKQADSELLLSYLTAPYIRIPLLLGFFADRERITLLREPQLQAILDAVLFEPGSWQPRWSAGKGLPETVPAPSRAHLATPAGLLFNELLKSPKCMLGNIYMMTKAAFDMDTGRAGAAHEGIILYMLRLAIRVDSYLAFLVSHTRDSGGSNMTGKVPGLPGYGSHGANAEIQDPLKRTLVKQALSEEHHRMHVDIFAKATGMLLRWTKDALKKREALLPAACRAYAHLALLYRSRARFEVKDVAIFLSAQVFVNHHHRWFQGPKASGSEDDVQPTLGVGDVELFDLFQTKRPVIQKWFQDNRQHVGLIMDTVERVALFQNTVPEALDEITMKGCARAWTELLDQPGNFMPAAEAPPAHWYGSEPGEDFRSWLLRTTTGLPESSSFVSLNTGLYMARGEKTELIPTWALESKDFLAAAGMRRMKDVTCSTISLTTERTRLRLLGQKHEVQRWEADTLGSLREDPQTVAAFAGDTYPSASQPKWLAAVLEPVRVKVATLACLTLHLVQRGPATDSVEAMLVATCGDASAYKGKSGSGQDGRGAVEVFVHRSPPLVEAFLVTEYGRSYYRTMVFTSDVAWSLHKPLVNERFLYNRRGRCWSLAAGDILPGGPGSTAPAASVLTFRHYEELVRQLFIPHRLLYGLLPDALIKKYSFWRAETPTSGGLIVGDETFETDTPTRLYLRLPAMGGNVAGRDGRVERARLKVPKATAAAEGAKSTESAAARPPRALWEVAEGPPEILLNLQRLRHSWLAMVLSSLENLTHILAWSSSGAKEDVQRVELPRLRLSFTRCGSSLMCDQHDGYWLCTREAPPAVAALQRQWGGGTALLENAGGEFAILASGIVEPVRPSMHRREASALESLLPEPLVFAKRGSEKWMANLRSGERHHFYLVSRVGTFVFAPTRTSALYLMLCRLLTWNFYEAIAVRTTLCSLETTEEKQLWSLFRVFAREHHADAVACRVHLSLAMLPFGADSATPWPLRDQALEYVRKRHLVSASCALSIDEELTMMNILEDSPVEPEETSTRKSGGLLRRTVHDVLHRAIGADDVSRQRDDGSWKEFRARKEVLVQMLEEPRLTFLDLPPDTLGALVSDDGFDEVVDQSYEDGIGMMDRFSSTIGQSTYMRPRLRQMVGTDALAFLDDLFEPVLRIPFPLLYEAFTATTRLQIQPDDDVGDLAAVLVRYKYGRGASKSVESSLLRLLAANSDLRSQIPKPKFGEENTVKDASVIAVDAVEWLQRERDNLPTQEAKKWPRPLSAHEQLIHDSSHYRHWSPPLAKGAICERSRLGSSPAADREAVAAFAGKPLGALAQLFCVQTRPESGGAMEATSQIVREALQQLSRLQEARSFLGKRTLQRYMDELHELTNQSKTLCTQTLKDASAASLANLSKLLAEKRVADSSQVEKEVKRITALANAESGTLDKLRKEANLRPALTFNDIAGALLASPEQVTEDLKRLVPMLSAQESSALLEDAAFVLAAVVRLGQVVRAQAAVDALLSEGGSLNHIAESLKAGMIAQALNESRHFAATSDGGAAATYDPRLLLFEVLINFNLRASQVKLLEKFSHHALRKQSLCHQMIMGAGKTTCVAPLLAMILATGDTLVCSCMPAALLQMSRAVMIERFSSPLVSKFVLTFHFCRRSRATEAMVAKLQTARERRAIIVATPSSLKSVLLKQLLLVCKLDESRIAKGHMQRFRDESRQTVRGAIQYAFGERGALSAAMLPEDDQRQLAVEVGHCSEVLAMFHSGVMLLDEVDVLLDPLKSELNWPVGVKNPIDLTLPGRGDSGGNQKGLRYRLPLHLLDAIFVLDGAPPRSAYKDRRDALSTIGRLKAAVDTGLRQHHLQAVPHLILVSQSFYFTDMLPLLVDWLWLFLEQFLVDTLKSDEVRGLLLQGRLSKSTESETEKNLRVKLSGAPDWVLKLLNLSITWLHNFFPHLLGHVHRVHYGLLSEEDIWKARHRGLLRISKARRLLAVPFVGKDCPSSTSEFAHPDITIGFTVLAYRIHGLRRPDFAQLIRLLRADMLLETTVKHARRAACKTFVSMVSEAGGIVKGFTAEGKFLGDMRKEDRQTAEAKIVQTIGQASEPKERFSVRPLEQLDLSDPEQHDVVYNLLRRSAQAIEYLLEQATFLPDNDTLDSTELQLSASGQELVGKQLFGYCLGFSGTPNELIPKSMGTCAFADGDDGNILSTLGDVGNVSIRRLEAWAPESILDDVAKADRSGMSKYHALIDTGALVTGLSNKEVADYLLRKGLPDMDGVVFLNAADEQVVLLRESGEVVALQQCGLPLHRRFTFYDHVHSVGMDIKQPPLCTAAITLSKDTTLRDFSQGAYRMRGLGRGQQVEVLLTPEVAKLVRETAGQFRPSANKLAIGGQGTTEGQSSKDDVQDGKEEIKGIGPEQEQLVDLLACLCLQGIMATDNKHLVLCGQNLRGLYRHAATVWLETAPQPEAFSAWLDTGQTKAALAELRIRTRGAALSNQLPTTESKSKKAESMAESYQREMEQRAPNLQLLLEQPEPEPADEPEEESPSLGLPNNGLNRMPMREEEVMAKAEEILMELQAHAAADAADVLSSEGQTHAEAALMSEKEQEEEAEQEEEQEQEREQDREVEMEVQADVASDEDDLPLPPERGEPIPVQPWSWRALTVPPTKVGSINSELPFFPLEEVQVQNGQSGETALVGLPDFVLCSPNHASRKRVRRGRARLKHVMCFLEYVPDISQLERLEQPALVDAKQCELLREVFRSYDLDNSQTIDAEEFKRIFRTMDLDKEGDTLVQTMASAKGGPGLTFDECQKKILSQTFCKMQRGRYFVALSLQEAEHLRAIMHQQLGGGASGGGTWPSRCGIALRSLGNLESGLENSHLDEHGPVTSSTELGYQREVAEQLLRFLNCSESFQARQLNILLRSLQATPVAERLAWWQCIRSCRRRATSAWQQTALAKVFTAADEYGSLATNALVARMRWALAARGLGAADAFQTLDTNGNGVLSKGEVARGLEWLGVRAVMAQGQDRWLQQVDAVFEALDKNFDNSVTLDEFTSLLELRESDKAMIPSSLKMLQQAAPQPEENDVDSEPEDRVVMERLLPECFPLKSSGRLRLRWEEHTEMKLVWTSQRSLMEKPLTFWEPVTESAAVETGGSQVRLAFGHIACVGLRPPSGIALLEIKDTQGRGSASRQDLQAVVEQLFPRPARYRQRWHQAKSSADSEHLYIWEPLPPSEDFVAIGMLASATRDEPPPEATRCAPKIWASSMRRVTELWSGSGANNIPASFFIKADDIQRTEKRKVLRNGFLTQSSLEHVDGTGYFQVMTESSQPESNPEAQAKWTLPLNGACFVDMPADVAKEERQRQKRRQPNVSSDSAAPEMAYFELNAPAAAVQSANPSTSGSAAAGGEKPAVMQFVEDQPPISHAVSLPARHMDSQPAPEMARIPTTPGQQALDSWHLPSGLHSEPTEQELAVAKVLKMNNLKRLKDMLRFKATKDGKYEPDIYSKLIAKFDKQRKSGLDCTELRKFFRVELKIPDSQFSDKDIALFLTALDIDCNGYLTTPELMRFTVHGLTGEAATPGSPGSASA